MLFTIAGGDDRFVRLARLLRSDGHEVRTLAQGEREELSPAQALQGVRCLILPLPCVREGALNAPLSRRAWSLEELLSAAAPGTLVLAGQSGPAEGLCRQFGLPLCDYYRREELAVKNALLTAEGAVELLIGLGERSLAGSEVLVLGFGRIGKLLSARLLALGARVTAAARSWTDLAWCQSLGCRALPLSREEGARFVPEGRFDFAVNTIPAPVFGEETLRALAGAKLLELASPPYGFDRAAAQRLGLSLTYAPGLPGRCAPESAAEILRDAVYHILEE